MLGNATSISGAGALLWSPIHAGPHSSTGLCADAVLRRPELNTGATRTGVAHGNPGKSLSDGVSPSPWKRDQHRAQTPNAVTVYFAARLAGSDADKTTGTQISLDRTKSQHESAHPRWDEQVTTRRRHDERELGRLPARGDEPVPGHGELPDDHEQQWEPGSSGQELPHAPKASN